MRRRDFIHLGLGIGLWGCGAGRAPAGGQWHAWGTQGTRDGSFIRPRAIGVRDGEVYVIDTTGRVQVFSTAGGFVRLWQLPEHENGTPTGISFAGGDRVIIPDTHYSRILEYTPEGALLDSWGAYGSGPDQFIYPTDIELDPEGNFFISEYGENAERVHVFDKDRKFLRQWGSHGAEPGQFNRAMSLTLSGGTQVFVADTANHRVQCFQPDGVLEHVIGAESSEGTGLKYPHDLCKVSDGSLLIAEYGTHRIARFSKTGVFLGAYGVPGRNLGELNGPRGVAVTLEGQVFVADTDNHRIQSFFLEESV